MARDTVDRRSFLKAAGSATVATTALAGCIGSDDDQGSTDAPEDTNGGGGGGGDDTDATETDGGDGKDASGLLTYARGNKSGTLDPQATSSGEDAKVIQQLYNQVIEFEPGKTTLRAGLAEEFTLEGQSVSLTLREGVKFHNGEEFTADDFIATYKRFMDEEYEYFVGTKDRSYYGPYLLSTVTDVSKDGDYGLTLELNAKHAPMLRNLAVFAFSIISKAAIEGGADIKSEPAGTGPFKLSNWDQANARIRLEHFPEYWGENSKVAEVVFAEIKQNSSRAQSLSTGEVDIIDGLGPQASQQVESSNAANLVTTPGINVGYMAMNMARMEPFRNKKVRQAMNYAVDTNALVNSIFSGLAVQSSQPVPENMAGYNDSVSAYPKDTEKAQSLLEEAGYGDGFDMELSTFQNPRTYNPSPLDAAQLVKSNLEEVGISVTVKQMEFNAFIEYTNQGKHDACFLGWMTDNADPDNFFYALLHPGVEEIPSGQDWVSFDEENFNTLNVAAWANPDYKRLVEEAQSTYDEATRRKKYEQASKIAHDEAPWVFLDHAKELRGVHKRVNGFTIAPISGPYLNKVSLGE
ncbi:ABC transporter substrate-binding protein [Haloarchaeobius sp. DT45]|uniref:ABC transporter substrate-binding protein n=1 Tax=Haloarchaeobius sp. DT45 TaxID=3446116 RepID=UPI003F6C3582